MPAKEAPLQLLVGVLRLSEELISLLESSLMPFKDRDGSSAPLNSRLKDCGGGKQLSLAAAAADDTKQEQSIRI